MYAVRSSAVRFVTVACGIRPQHTMRARSSGVVNRRGDAHSGAPEVAYTHCGGESTELGEGAGTREVATDNGTVIE